MKSKPSKDFLGVIAKQHREQAELARLRQGEVPKLVGEVTKKLEENVGRWHKIYYGRCRPGYLYYYNREKDRLDQRVTMRGVTQCLRGETDHYFAMLLPGGVKGEFVA
jgi:hypothetical protein